MRVAVAVSPAAFERRVGDEPALLPAIAVTRANACSTDWTSRLSEPLRMIVRPSKSALATSPPEPPPSTRRGCTAAGAAAALSLERAPSKAVASSASSPLAQAASSSTSAAAVVRAAVMSRIGVLQHAGCANLPAAMKDRRLSRAVRSLGADPARTCGTPRQRAVLGYNGDTRGDCVRERHGDHQRKPRRGRERARRDRHLAREGRARADAQGRRDHGRGHRRSRAHRRGGGRGGGDGPGARAERQSAPTAASRA